ncbi:MAG: hypothetical protein A2X20_02025 [Bacteroidetes bacterium GWE2_40_15]|nr:MAG: hypothetical protein A2X20_02025 [Bacteroidetes bacterium GWE2_40_15]
MKFNTTSIFIIAFSFSLVFNNMSAQNVRQKTDETIFVFGGDISLKFVQYVVDLTKKQNPKVCYLPTASADNEDNIKLWSFFCKQLSIEPFVLKVWVSSDDSPKTFEETLLDMDAIVVGGGNTLNMIGIWKAQGIDIILNKALKKGVVLAGGSAGSICWFKSGISDSRPVKLSIVNGLGFLKYSNCPHYSVEARSALYLQMIKEKQMPFGYACDDRAGILFKNGKAVDFVSQSDKHNSFFIKKRNGVIQEIKMESRILINKNALADSTYICTSVKQKLKDLIDIDNVTTPLNSFVTEQKNVRLKKEGIAETERDAVLNIGIEKIFIYDNKLAGVVNDAYIKSFGYGLWYFYNCNGVWKSVGEDIGGETVFESEITFREKAANMIARAEKLYPPNAS